MVESAISNDGTPHFATMTENRLLPHSKRKEIEESLVQIGVMLSDFEWAEHKSEELLEKSMKSKGGYSPIQAARRRAAYRDEYEHLPQPKVSKLKHIKTEAFITFDRLDNKWFSKYSLGNDYGTDKKVFNTIDEQIRFAQLWLTELKENLDVFDSIDLGVAQPSQIETTITKDDVVSNMVEKQIELIKKQIEKIDERSFDLDAWKSSTKVILARIFGGESKAVSAIEDIKYQNFGVATIGYSSFSNNIHSCKTQGKDILQVCIAELEIFGQPDTTTKDNAGININLTQNQTVNIQLLISALEDGLTVSQMKEIKELVASDEPDPQKKGKIIQKLKSFGSDVASNILANILTNPGIWGGLL